MSSNIVNQMPYLRTSREFPAELNQLTVEVNKSYIDTSNAVNTRTIGIFTINSPAINGETWFVSSQRQQGLRQVYTFTTTATIPLGFKINTIAGFTRFFGTYLSVTSWYGLIPATNVAIAGQITFWVEVDGASTTSDSIRFNVGAGAPALTSGTLVIEWIGQP